MQWADNPLLFIAGACVGQLGIALLVEEKSAGRGQLPTRSSDERTWNQLATINFSHAENFEGQIEISKFSKMVPKLDAHKYKNRCLRVLQSARGIRKGSAV